MIVFKTVIQNEWRILLGLITTDLVGAFNI
jgi:hypothetical protein